MPTPLDTLNASPRDDAIGTLLRTCGSRRWAESMAARRPFPTNDALLAAAESAFDTLTPSDWLEAFAHHPRIGENNLAQPRFAATRDQSSREQSGMAAATDDERSAFLAGNRQYEHRFGHVFLICATGKSAAEMLSQLTARLASDPATELDTASSEQRKITRLRLVRLLSS